MPGFMGIRGLDWECGRRRDGERKASHGELKRRAREKATAILRDLRGGGEREGVSGRSGDSHVDKEPDRREIAGFTVAEIMSANVAALGFDDDLLTVECVFSSVNFSHLPIVDEGGKIIGILSDKDFMRTVSPFFNTINEQTRDREIMTRKVGTIMTRDPVCAGIGTTVMNAVCLMTDNRISCLPVVEEGGMRLLGIVTWKDVARAFCPEMPAPNPLRDPEQSGTDARPAPRSESGVRALLRNQLEKAKDNSRLRALRDEQYHRQMECCPC